MGIGSLDLEIFIRLSKEGHFSGHNSVIEIGAQQLSNSFLEARTSIDECAHLFGIVQTCPLPDPSATHIIHGGLGHQDSEAPPARIFWNWLNFNYASVDIDGSPGSIALDLNYDPAPPEVVGKFQLVTNFGTTEHVANQLNAFKVIHDLTAPGGVMIHNLPAQGMANHGLINYNPKFFWMLARSNGYNLLNMDYSGTPITYDLPENIVNYVKSFRPDITARLDGHRISDAGLIAVLQKAYDLDFVPPLDVATGTTTDNQALAERYWTVFKADAFQTLRRWNTGSS